MSGDARAALGLLALCGLAALLTWALLAPLVDGAVARLPEAPAEWPCARETAPGQYATPSAVPSPACTLVPR